MDEALKGVSRHFSRLYAPLGRPSIPPEKLLRGLLLMVLYSIRSERRLIEELEYNLLYRWFVGLGMDESVWDATTFSKNRERFIDGEVARRFFQQVLREAKQRDLVSEEHFSVDGTLIEAWASLKSFRPKEDIGLAAAGRSGQRDGQLQRRAAEQRNASVANGSGGAIGAKRRRQGSQAFLLR